MLQAFAEAIMSAQASMQCGAGYGEQASELVIAFWRPARGLMRGQERLTSPRTPLVGA